MKPVLVVPTSYREQFTDAVMATWLGAFYALYTVSVSAEAGASQLAVA